MCELQPRNRTARLVRILCLDLATFLYCHCPYNPERWVLVISLLTSKPKPRKFVQTTQLVVIGKVDHELGVQALELTHGNKVS